MTKAERLMKSGPFSIKLSRERNGKLHEDYTAEFKPDFDNPLHITDKDFDAGDLYNGNGIILSRESAAELAKFLKRLFLDEDAKD
ncbi:MAG: hypothetical protein LBH44_00330 [Treponema sp.]|nr:hypothetical protein [Treponema sp.]